MRSLLLALALALTVSGCSVLRLWNPLADGVEQDERITLRQSGVVLEVRSFAFLNGDGPEVTLVFANESGGPVSVRPAAFRVASGDSLLAPRRAPEAFALTPGEARTLELSFPLRSGRWDGPQDATLTLVPGGIEAAGSEVAFPPVRYVDPRRGR